MTSVLLIGLYVFVLSIFVGFEIISKVPPMLHTPLMSGTNAISGITLVGAVVAAGFSQDLGSGDDDIRAAQPPGNELEFFLVVIL